MEGQMDEEISLDLKKYRANSAAAGIGIGSLGLGGIGIRYLIKPETAEDYFSDILMEQAAIRTAPQVESIAGDYRPGVSSAIRTTSLKWDVQEAFEQAQVHAASQRRENVATGSFLIFTALAFTAIAVSARRRANQIKREIKAMRVPANAPAASAPPASVPQDPGLF
jgi:hypothetical protein